MIQGYPDQPSVLPGGTLTLHVSTDALQFRVDLYRQGQILEFKSSSSWLPGQLFPTGPANHDWGWPGYTFPIPWDWPSSAYIAVFVEGDANGNQISFPDTSTADGRDSKALFVVKSAQPGTSASILFKVSLNTHHAYNYSGGGSLYSTQAPSDPGDPFGDKVTMLRPGGGTGGEVTDFHIPDVDVYNPGTSPQAFAHWEPLFIGWLETNGYQVDYCTDLDIHEDADLNLLNSYNLLLSVGHDEYWSEGMRNNLEAFIANGGNVAFFSGNTCWWRIHYVDNNTAFVCDKGTATDQWWKATPIASPENTLTGVSYRCGGGDWGGQRAPVGYKVQHADHWVYEGTGLHNGDVFGKDEHLIGYECDGAFFDNNQDSNGFFIPTGQDQTPLNFIILGIGLLDGTGWKDLPQPPAGREQELIGSNAATTGMYTNNGTVFTGATTDWVRVLAQGQEPRAEQITRNVLNRMGGSASGRPLLASFNSIVGLAGFYTPNDNYRHVIVATGDGNLYEVFYNPSVGLGVSAPLANFNGIVGLSAFYTPNDNYRHAMVATSDGNLYEVFFVPGQSPAISAPLANFSGIVGLGAFYTPNDNYRHAMVATSDGNLYEVFFIPGQSPAVSAPQANISGIVGLDAFYTPDDDYHHAIVATNNGNLYEVFGKPGTSPGISASLATFSGIVGVGAYYTPDDTYFTRHVSVATSDGDLYEVYLQPGFSPLRTRLATFNSIVKVAGFYTSDDNYRHSIVATNDGNVYEVFFKP